MTHRIILPQWQHVAGLKGAVSLIHRRIKIQPAESERVGNLQFYRIGDVCAGGKCGMESAEVTDALCPYKPGDTLACLEPWARAVGAPPKSAVYAYDDPNRESWIWPIPSRMPLRACRLKFTVVSTRAVRICDVTEEEAVKAGMETERVNEEPSIWSAKLPFCEDWLSRGRRGDDWVWALEVAR